MRKLVMLSLDACFEQDLSLWQGTSLGVWMEKAAGCTKVKTVFPALTYPAHITLVTGCDPVQHRIGQNQPFQPDIEAAMRVWYWDSADVKCETLFDAVKSKGGNCASMLWPVTGKSKAIRWNFPEVLALPGENQVLKMLRYGKACWMLKKEVTLGRKRKSIHEPDLSDYAIALSCDVIRRHQPTLTCAHLVDVDEMRHHHGVHGQESIDALHRMEKRVDAIWQAMQNTPGMEDALLVLVSDHGQMDVDETVNLTMVLKEAGIDARVQSNGMSAYLFDNPSNPESIEDAKEYLMKEGDKIGIAHVYDREELNRLGCIEEVALAVEAKNNVVFEDGLPQTKREKATHGFGPGSPAENCFFLVRGKGIKEGVRLDDMPMRDVAPTIAGLMGIHLKDATGQDHSAKLE